MLRNTMLGVLATIVISLGSYSAYAEQAAIIRDTGCGIPTPSSFVFTANSLIIQTFSERGVTVLKCKASITDYTEGQFTNSGFDCGILQTGGGFVITNDSHVTISASGKATLTCKFKN
jgi:hypothetical protein